MIPNTNTFSLILEKLKQSKFRRQFSLKEKEKQYIQEKGLKTIQKHAYDFIEKRLAPAFIINDGKQTPMKGHPIFIAQHATATCCRNCLYKWHHIPKGVPLTADQKHYIVSLCMIWIEKQMSGECQETIKR